MILSEAENLLASVRVENFLSFYKGTVEFDPGLTVITGPNGSGKTSIFHAVKFALGSNQREKRYSKWSDFIRYGASSAEVELTVVSDGQTQKLLRKIDRDGVPRAYIDGKRVKAAEHNNAVEKLGIDVDNPLVFMPQERINALRDMNPIEVRKLVEEGTGLGILRDRISSQETQVAHDTRRLESAVSEAQVVQQEIELLQKDLKRLFRKRELQATERDLKFELKWATIGALEKKLYDTRSEIEEREEGLVEVIAESAELEAKRSEEEDRSEAIEERMERLQREIGNIDARIKEEENRLLRLEDDSKKAGLEVRKLEQEMKNEERKKDKIIADLRRGSNAKEEYMESLKRLRTELEGLEGEQDELEDSMAIFSEWNTKRAEAYGTYKALQGQLESKDVMLRSLRERLQVDEAELESIQSRWGNVWDSLESTDQKDLARRKSSLENLLATLNEKRFRENTRAAQLQKQVEDLRIQLSETSERIPKNVRDLKATLQVHGLTNVFGPVIEMVKADNALGPAVEAVLRDELAFSFIVTDEAEYALLERLRNQMDASSPVIFLQSDEDGHDEVSLKEEGVRGELWNLVGLEKPYERLLSRAFGRIIVTEESRMASRLARKKGITAVSLEGHLVVPENTRTMSYPAREPSGLVSTAPLQSRLEELEKQRKEASKSVTEIITELEKVTEEREEVAELLSHFTRWGRIWEKRKELMEGIPELQERVVATDDELKELQRQFGIAERELRALDNTQPPERSRLVGKQRAIRMKQKRLQQDLSQAEANLNATERDEALKRQEMKSIEEDIAMLSNRLEELREEMKSSKSSARTILDTIETLKTGREKAEEELESVRSELQTSRDVIRELAEQLVELNLGIKNSQLQVLQLKRQMSNMEIELEETRKALEGEECPEGVRPLEDVRHELVRVRAILDDYQDVSEVLAQNESKLKQRLVELTMKVEEIREELEEAEEAVRDIRTQYHNGMNETLREVEHEVNDILSTVKFAAEVRFELSMNDGEYGVDFKSRIKSEEYKEISAGSGGERSLIAIGLILALQRFNPAPVYALDEIDTFLDATNTEMVSRLLHDSSRRSQFIIFTPAKSTHLLKHADRRIGVVSPKGTEPSVIIESPRFEGQ